MGIVIWGGLFYIGSWLIIFGMCENEFSLVNGVFVVG